MSHLNYYNRTPTVQSLNTVIDQFFSESWTGTASASDEFWKPECDVLEEEGYFLLNLDMPGVPRNQMKIETLGDELIITGERKNETNRRDGLTGYRERRFGKFRRSFKLPSALEPSKIQAYYEDGVLSLMIPKPEAERPREIKIGSSSDSGFFSKFLDQAKGFKKDQADAKSAS